MLLEILVLLGIEGVAAPILKVPSDIGFLHFTPTGRKDNWVFWVKTISDAKIGVSGNDRKVAAYVNIGASANTMSFIYDLWSSAYLVFHKETGMLDADTFRPFWLDWSKGNLTLGKGTEVGHGAILSWELPVTLSVSYLALSTYGQIPGYWMLVSECEKTERNSNLPNGGG